MDKKQWLKGKIVMQFGTQGKLAEAIGMSRSELNMKVNGYWYWKPEEVEAMTRLLKLSDQEAKECFGHDIEN